MFWAKWVGGYIELWPGYNEHRKTTLRKALKGAPQHPTAVTVLYPGVDVGSSMRKQTEQSLTEHV